MNKLPNYHKYSIQQEKRHEEELLILLSLLLKSLNDLSILTPQNIEQIIQSWKIDNWSSITELTTDHLITLDQHAIKLIAKYESLTSKFQRTKIINGNSDIIYKLYEADLQMLNVTIDYIKSKFIELSVLENTYKYTDAQSTAFIVAIVNGVESKVNTFVVQSTINNLRELLLENAKQKGFTEYKWRTQRDDRVRPLHAQMDDRWFRIDDPAPQPLGLQPGEDWGCRCYMIEFR